MGIRFCMAALALWATALGLHSQEGPSGALSSRLGQAFVDRFGKPAVLVVTRGGRSLVESHAPGKGPESRIPLNALGLAVSGALFGTALQEGFIPSIDAKVEEVLAKRSGEERFHAISFRHFLTDTTGLSGFEECWWNGDAIKYAYKSRIGHNAGEFWAEASEDCIFVAEAVAMKAGLSIEAYARRHLIEPLGITDFPAFSTRQGYMFGWGGLAFQPRDLAKILGLFLEDGLYHGARLLPKGFAADALGLQLPIAEDRRPAKRIAGLGYWWYVLEGPSPAPCVAFGQGGSLDDALQLLVYLAPATGTSVILWLPEAGGDFTRDDLIDFVESTVLPAL